MTSGCSTKVPGHAKLWMPFSSHRAGSPISLKIQLDMRLYTLGALEAKEETFMIHAALQPHSSKDKNSQSFPLIFVILVITSKAPLPLSTPVKPFRCMLQEIQYHLNIYRDVVPTTSQCISIPLL